MPFDIIVIGGGLAGSTFAALMSQAGHRVLVLQGEDRFRDRVRGENMLPWGVSAARRLGVLDDLTRADGHRVAFWMLYLFGKLDQARNLPSTTPHGEPALNMYVSRAAVASAGKPRSASSSTCAGRPEFPPAGSLGRNRSDLSPSSRVSSTVPTGGPSHPPGMVSR